MNLISDYQPFRVDKQAEKKSIPIIAEMNFKPLWQDQVSLEI